MIEDYNNALSFGGYTKREDNFNTKSQVKIISEKLAEKQKNEDNQNKVRENQQQENDARAIAEKGLPGMEKVTLEEVLSKEFTYKIEDYNRPVAFSKMKKMLTKKVINDAKSSLKKQELF